jgi:hypothetical protein
MFQTHKRGISPEVTEMGWDKGRYYTRSKKLNGRVVREYVGAGQIGALAAEMDTLDREQRQRKRDDERTRRTELDALDASVDELFELTERLVRATLSASGFHEHKGQWRVRRVGKKE